MPEITIDKNVPLTGGTGYGRSTLKYPWDTMEVGDSFLVIPKEGEELRYLAQKMSAMSSTRSRMSKTGRAYTTRYRKEENGVRVWRVS